MNPLLLEELEQWSSRGEFARVLVTCDQLLKDSAYKPAWSQLLYWKGIAHSGLGSNWYGEAISCLREGMRLAGKDRPLKVRHMAALGLLYSDLGDCAPFDAMLKEFKRLSRDQDPKVMRYGTFLWFNFGVALNNSFHYKEAAQAYSEAARLARQFDVPPVLGPSLHNLGGVQIILGQLEEAKALMDEAETFPVDTDDWRAKRLNRRAEYHLATGDLVSAQQEITEALLQAEADDYTKADIYYTWALTLRALGRPGEARERALQALGYALKAVHHTCMHNANHLLQQLGPEG